MATYATDLSLVNAADSSTGWAELSGHQSGGAPSADTENYLQNSTSVSQSTGQASGTAAGMQYTNGTNYYTGWTSGNVFMMWQYYTAPTNLQPWASGGMRIGIGSSSGNMDFWNAMGDNFSGSPYACWQNTAIDPEITSDASDGSPSGTNYSYFGSLPNVRAKISKGSPHAVDIIRYGRGEIYATGTGGTFSGYATANDAATARWGLFQAVRGGYLWKGLFSLGQSGTSLTFSDSNKAIFIDDTPRVAAGFNKIEINNASSSITWTGITFSGVGTSITGSAPVSPGDFEVVNNATVSLTSCSFTDMGTFDFLSNSTVTGCTFRRCGLITTGGGDFDTCLITNSGVAVSLSCSTLADLTDCTFESDGSNHAVDLGNVTTTQSMNWNNYDTGYAGSDGSTGNETIKVNVTTGQTLTINVGSGYSTPSIYNVNSANSTVTVVSGQVTTTIHVVDVTDGSDLEDARVYLVADSGGPLTAGTVIFNTLTDVNGEVSDTRSLASDQPVSGWVRLSSPPGPYYKTGPISATIDNASGLSLTVQLIPDE